jgi:hypothetical protein
MRPKQNLKPKNGKYLVALIAGAPADRARELRDFLASRRGILAQYHWDYEKPNQFGRVPEDVDVVFIIKSQLGHSLEGRVVGSCESQGIPYIRTIHKWTIFDSAVRQRLDDETWGKKSLPPEISSTAYFKEPKCEVPREAEPPKYVRELPAEDKLAKLFAQKDTMSLIMELQGRMVALGVDSLLLTQTEVTLARSKP